MKNKLCSLVLAGVACGILSASAFASDGTVTITGNISDATCKVGGDGPDGNIALALDKVGASSLAKVGDTAGFKPFSIKLTDCAAGATGLVKAGFETGPNTDLTSGRLTLSGETAAANVQLQVRNGDDTVIKIGDNSTVKGATIADKAATLNYKVGYYATGAAAAGDANSSVTYSIIYP